MERNELLRSEAYWTEKIKLDLYQIVSDYKEREHLTLENLASKLDVTKGYLSQILNGNFDHKISKLVQLSMACNMVPIIKYEPIDQYIQDDLDDNCDGHYKERPIINVQLNFEDTKKEYANGYRKKEANTVF